jgi:hypothetical protein
LHLSWALQADILSSGQRADKKAGEVDVVPLLFSHAAMSGRDEDLLFRIELWDDGDKHVEEVIALVSDFLTASGAPRRKKPRSS